MKAGEREEGIRGYGKKGEQKERGGKIKRRKGNKGKCKKSGGRKAGRVQK